MYSQGKGFQSLFIIHNIYLPIEFILLELIKFLPSTIGIDKQ